MTRGIDAGLQQRQKVKNINLGPNQCQQFPRLPVTQSSIFCLKVPEVLLT